MSEIFNKYAEIALKEGIISDKVNLKKEAKKEDVSAIEALYGIKPSMIKSMDYEKNIMEIAHPNSSVILPCYDKLNGLVENNIQRQNVMLNIVHTTPSGHLTNKKYAESELIHSLIRIANDMDNKDKDQLRILADTCANQLKKSADSDWLSSITNWFKDKSDDSINVGTGAAVGGIIGGLIGAFGGPVTILGGARVGSLLGGLAASIFKTSPQAKNVSINADIARKELQDLIKILPEDKSLPILDDALLNLSITAKQYASVVSQSQTSNTTSESDKKLAEELTTKYMEQLVKTKKLSYLFLNAAKSGQFAQNENEYWSKIKKPFNALFGIDDDVEDEEAALQSLIKVMENAIQDIKNVRSQAINLKDHVENE